MQNYFDTLEEALKSEGLEDAWKPHYSPIGCGETCKYVYPNGTRYGHFVKIYRDNQGKYHRPVHHDRVNEH